MKKKMSESILLNYSATAAGMVDAGKLKIYQNEEKNISNSVLQKKISISIYLFSLTILKEKKN